jgi:hypothetical protein
MGPGLFNGKSPEDMGIRFIHKSEILDSLQKIFGSKNKAMTAMGRKQFILSVVGAVAFSAGVNYLLKEVMFEQPERQGVQIGTRLSDNAPIMLMPGPIEPGKEKILLTIAGKTVMVLDEIGFPEEVDKQIKEAVAQGWKFNKEESFGRSFNIRALTYVQEGRPSMGFLKAGNRGFKILSRSKDHALATPKATGGIDLDRAKMQMNIHKEAAGVNMQFDPAMAERIRKEGFEGIEFTIQHIIPVDNLQQLLFS